MAGNMWEWTTETGKHGTASGSSNGTYAVRRGGSFDNYGSGSPLCYRDGNTSTSDYHVSFGFRVALYIK